MNIKYSFHNFTDKPFTGAWNGKPYTFNPGKKQEYPKLIAEHFAKHLTNQILTDSGKETFTSPKKPKEVPQFMEIFQKALIMEEIAEADNLGIESERSEDEPSMNIQTKPREAVDPYDANATPQTGPGNAPETISVPVEKEEVKEVTDESKDYQAPEEKTSEKTSE